ncbi:hypothetical protein JMJ77_0009272, partial [Colletotrichum scovillei]
MTESFGVMSNLGKRPTSGAYSIYPVADRPGILTKRHFIRRRAAVGQSSFADVSNSTSAFIP